MKNIAVKTKRSVLTGWVVFNRQNRVAKTLYTAGVLLLVALLGYFFIRQVSHRPTLVNVDGVKSAQTEQTVSFKPLFPESPSNIITPKYNSDRNIVSFADSFRGASLTVSQQLAPPSAKSDDQFLIRISETAPGIKKPVFTTKGNAVVATDPVSQQQTVIFLDGEVLVFIRTPQLLQDSDWVEYVSKMKS